MRGERGCTVGLHLMGKPPTNARAFVGPDTVAGSPERGPTTDRYRRLSHPQGPRRRVDRTRPPAGSDSPPSHGRRNARAVGFSGLRGTPL